LASKRVRLHAFTEQEIEKIAALRIRDEMDAWSIERKDSPSESSDVAL
jgi:hypothetical protein